MNIKFEYEYEFGVLVYDGHDYDYRHRSLNSYNLEVDSVVLDTANNPSKTTSLFADDYSWNSLTVKRWIEERVNNV